MKKILKLASEFDTKLKSLATREAYFAIKRIADLAKKMLVNTLDFQRAALDEKAWDPNTSDLYEEIDSEMTEKNVYEAKKLIEDIARITDDFRGSAYYYGISAKGVAEYKSELLMLANRLSKTDNGSGKMKTLISPFVEAVTSLEPRPVFRQGRMGTTTPGVKDGDIEWVPGEAWPRVWKEVTPGEFKLVRQVMPTSNELDEEPSGAGIAYTGEEDFDYPLPPGLFDDESAHVTEQGLTPAQRDLVERAKRYQQMFGKK